MRSAKRKTNKINQISSGWGTKAPAAIFSGMTLDKFKEAVKPALDAEAKLADLLVQVKVARKDFVNLADSAYRIALRAVDGVKGDEAYGDNSSLYEAMGYIARMARKSGLTRKKAAEAVTEPKS